ncbi:MAG: hypothetical protein HY756_07095 [Nitrospirae bacterium]|nr:hypothetical protein [Nitrospirota bacterium]
MKYLMKRLENLFTAAAFAEEGEYKTAREIVNEKLSPIEELKQKVHLTIDDLTSMATAFAEAGEHEKAVEIMKEAGMRIEEVKTDLQRGIKGIALAPEQA